MSELLANTVGSGVAVTFETPARATNSSDGAGPLDVGVTARDAANDGGSAVIVDANGLELSFVSALMAKMGYGREAAKATVSHLMAAERSGRDCHGLVRLKPLFDNAFGFISWKRPTPERTVGSVLTYDGAGVPGYYVASVMLEDAIEEVKRSGLCLALAQNVYPSGYLGHYGRLAAEAGMVAHIEATSPSRVTAPGHTRAFVGTNPVCRAYPIEGHTPMVLDFATSAITHGDLLVAEASGAELPEHCAVTCDGTPVRFPNDFNAAQGEGAILPFGGNQAYKAFGLALGVALQCSYGGSKPASPGGTGFGMSILLFDAQRVGESSESFRAAWVSALDADERVRIPGWNSIRRAQSWERRGLVSIDNSTWQLIRKYLPNDAAD